MNMVLLFIILVISAIEKKDIWHTRATGGVRAQKRFDILNGNKKRRETTRSRGEEGKA
jgi:hypothetical protein